LLNAVEVLALFYAESDRLPNFYVELDCYKTSDGPFAGLTCCFESGVSTKFERGIFSFLVGAVDGADFSFGGMLKQGL
jgi:hypothetical protein